MCCVISDDYNIPIEIPLIVQTLSDQHLDVVPESKADQVTETQLIISQRTFDCEQFVQRRAQKLCSDSQLEYRHCEDYDIKLVHVRSSSRRFDVCTGRSFLDMPTLRRYSVSGCDKNRCSWDAREFGQAHVVSG